MRRPVHSFSRALAVGALIASFAVLWAVVLGLAAMPERGACGDFQARGW